MWRWGNRWTQKKCGGGGGQKNIRSYPPIQLKMKRPLYGSYQRPSTETVGGSCSYTICSSLREGSDRTTYFKVPALEIGPCISRNQLWRQDHVFQGTSSGDRTTYFREPFPGTSSGDWTTYFKVPALEIGPRILRYQLWRQDYVFQGTSSSRQDHVFQRNQLWRQDHVFQGTSSGDRTTYFKEPALEK